MVFVSKFIDNEEKKTQAKNGQKKDMKHHNNRISVLICVETHQSQLRSLHSWMEAFLAPDPSNSPGLGKNVRHNQILGLHNCSNEAQKSVEATKKSNGNKH